MSGQECGNCQTVSDEEAGIIVGPTGHGGSMCTICRADELREATVLSKQESKVAAHKQISGASHATIAERVGLEKSTVDEYSRRFKEKVTKSRATTNELSEFLLGNG